MGTDKSISKARRPLVIEAATKIFARYGYAKTTMGDIARAAGIGRPTLYASFPDKQSILDSVIAKVVEEKLAEIQNGLNDKVSLADQLLFACETWSLEGFLHIRSNPDIEDLFDFHALPVRLGQSRFQSLLAGILDRHLSATEHSNAVDRLARLMAAAMKGFNSSAENELEFIELLRSLVQVIVTSVSIDEHVSEGQL